MKCVLCGQENSEKARFCRTCGTRIMGEDVLARKVSFDPADTFVPRREIQEREKEYPPVISGKDGAEMVLVPSGEFLMGSDDSFANERPLHAMWLAPFYIDRCPVTNRQFERFVKSSGYRPRGDWRAQARPGREVHPVVNVTWSDAMAYGAWAGKCLPLEEQWEKAARGADGRLYPWGNGWKPGNVNCRASGYGATTAVGICPEGTSPYGCLDMAGNVWEWTVSFYEPYAGSGYTSVCFGMRLRVMKGGSWRTAEAANFRCSARMPSEPNRASDMRGFRCVKPI